MKLECLPVNTLIVWPWTLTTSSWTPTLSRRGMIRGTPVKPRKNSPVFAQNLQQGEFLCGIPQIQELRPADPQGADLQRVLAFLFWPMTEIPHKWESAPSAREESWDLRNDTRRLEMGKMYFFVLFWKIPKKKHFSHLSPNHEISIFSMMHGARIQIYNFMIRKKYFFLQSTHQTLAFGVLGFV